MRSIRAIAAGCAIPITSSSRALLRQTASSSPKTPMISESGRVNVHPGLIILPSVARAEAQRLMDIVIAHLTDAGGERPQDLLVNSVLTITLAADIRIDPLP